MNNFQLSIFQRRSVSEVSDIGWCSADEPYILNSSQCSCGMPLLLLKPRPPWQHRISGTMIAIIQGDLQFSHSNWERLLDGLGPTKVWSALVPLQIARPRLMPAHLNQICIQLAKELPCARDCSNNSWPRFRKPFEFAEKYSGADRKPHSKPCQMWALGRSSASVINPFLMASPCAQTATSSCVKSRPLPHCDCFFSTSRCLALQCAGEHRHDARP